MCVSHQAIEQQLTAARQHVHFSQQPSKACTVYDDTASYVSLASGIAPQSLSNRLSSRQTPLLNSLLSTPPQIHLSQHPSFPFFSPNTLPNTPPPPPPCSCIHADPSDSPLYSTIRARVRKEVFDGAENRGWHRRGSEVSSVGGRGCTINVYERGCCCGYEASDTSQGPADLPAVAAKKVSTLCPVD